MTLCVAVTVPCDELAKRERRLQFVENGIIMLADSRFSYEQGRRRWHEDDGLKVVPLSDRCLLGYAGVATVVGRAMQRLNSDLTSRWPLAAGLIATRLSGYLSEEQRRSRVKDRLSTDVLLGLRSQDGRRFSLFSLSSVDGFQPRPRRGVYAVGSGAAEYYRRFDAGIDYQIQQLLEAPHPADCFLTDSGQAVLRSSLFRDGMRLMRLHDVVAAVSVIALEQILKGTDPTVGGAYQCYTLRRSGWSPVGAIWERGDTWDAVTRSDLSIPTGPRARIALKQPLVVKSYSPGDGDGSDAVAPSPPGMP